jgi:hypothetical protein
VFGRVQTYQAQDLDSSSWSNAARLGGRWKTRRGLKGLFGVPSRLGRIDTLDRWMEKKSPKGEQPLVESGRGEGKRPTIELAYLEGGKVRRASAWCRGKTCCQERIPYRIKALKSLPWLARAQLYSPFGARGESG